MAGISKSLWSCNYKWCQVFQELHYLAIKVGAARLDLHYLAVETVAVRPDLNYLAIKVVAVFPDIHYLAINSGGRYTHIFIILESKLWPVHPVLHYFAIQVVADTPSSSLSCIQRWVQVYLDFHFLQTKLWLYAQIFIILLSNWWPAYSYLHNLAIKVATGTPRSLLSCNQRWVRVNPVLRYLAIKSGGRYTLNFIFSQSKCWLYNQIIIILQSKVGVGIPRSSLFCNQHSGRRPRSSLSCN